LDAVASLASGVAHTVNNLMTVVLSGIEQAARQAVSDSQRRQLARADQAARGAGRLTQQMLSFARRQFLEAVPIDLNILVAGLDELIRQMVGDITVGFVYAGQAVPARLDARQFETALLALVRNAVDASVPGDHIEVSTREYTLFDGTDGHSGRVWVEIAVVDRGSGMSAETFAKATMPFFSTTSGTGLGLPMVSGYVEQSGGKLSIESHVGQGTTVRMAFPRHVETIE
jgi:signal transduction histidine kinase